MMVGLVSADLQLVQPIAAHTQKAYGTKMSTLCGKLEIAKQMLVAVAHRSARPVRRCLRPELSKDM